MKDTPKHRT